MSQFRPYRGVDGQQRIAERRRRLLEAGLDLLGGPAVSSDQATTSDLTVRAICSQSGLAARYFYESFTDKDAFVGAVFDWVVADIAATTQAAVAAVPMREQSRAGMANIVRTISDDARVGRLLFSTHLANSAVVRKRTESGALFALLSGQQFGTSLQLEPNDRIKAAGHFVVGGVAQTLSTWLSGDIAFTPAELATHLAALIDQLADPALYQG
ncbi:transcriptional regulator [Mycolicibacterium cyprinidarum]|uniref:Transcriptional regulator n=1 Tax=Mycolicibacterium cyprinidarum TaxID=2860311 RepID=A0ABQ4VE20_9MYCO|nr:transcriptional regulator [Mycolicibacterium sp. NGTWSNA01]GJF15732.1 transcriptional regulator [Mycolicibacterium sp. NGTWS1803]GJF19565.1 transcriptional regulator [Mycolicibacterium sp. NGTWS0302]